MGSLPAEFPRNPNAPDAGREFLVADRALDRATTGPLWLARPDIAQTVVDALEYGAESLRRYDLHAWVIMANHVHILISPHEDIDKIMARIKGRTARVANEILYRTGIAFWRREYFDRWMRTSAEFQRVAQYIEMNPVRAGIVSNPEDYPWSSRYAGSRKSL